jgi:N utilization substance protein A
MVGQLLASEGFNSVEELSMVDLKDIASIEGFDEETASELQIRAQDYLARVEAEYEERSRELGVSSELREVPGMTARMMVAFGENAVKTVEDLAGCATDDLAGWSERKDGETIRNPGYLEGFDLTREECEMLIMQARLKAGWITEAEFAAHQGAHESADEDALAAVEEDEAEAPSGSGQE